MRYGCVIWDDDWKVCFALARARAAQSHMSITPEPVRLVVRRLNGRWEAAWETRAVPAD